MSQEAHQPPKRRQTALIYSPALVQASLPDRHPLKLDRPEQLHALIEAYGLLAAPGVREVAPTTTTTDAVCAIHADDYVEVVKRLSVSEHVAEEVAQRHGFSAFGDNPPFPSMFEYHLLVSGASLAAVQLVSEGSADAAFSPAGGANHHALRDQASGFGVFNDAAIALAWLRDRGLRAAYVDIDVHQGDGVEAAFVDSDDVLTISLHESTLFLFPGPQGGFAEHIGEDKGRGYAVNVPFAPHTDDATWLWAFEEIVPPLLTAFQPDIVVTQLGADGYFNDPLAHLRLTTHAYETAIGHLRDLAPRWAALGGGGYDTGATARVWALAFGIMAGVELPDDLPSSYAKAHGGETLRDPPGVARPNSDTQPQVREFAEASVHTVQRLVFPIHGLSTA
ncbi:MAG: acetoin utilization protein AcuC [Dehalococcoidia bacterium]|nr:acetoin utilization protein AcuC [Dehalococcoidia bacterium]